MQGARGSNQHTIHNCQTLQTSRNWWEYLESSGGIFCLGPRFTDFSSSGLPGRSWIWRVPTTPCSPSVIELFQLAPYTFFRWWSPCSFFTDEGAARNLIVLFYVRGFSRNNQRALSSILYVNIMSAVTTISRQFCSCQSGVERDQAMLPLIVSSTFSLSFLIYQWVDDDGFPEIGLITKSAKYIN